MANFPVNPQPFLVRDMQVDHGWNRPARGRLALGGEPPREHEEYAIVSIQPPPPALEQLRPTLDLVCNFLEHDQRVRISTAHLSPLGLGLIKLHSVVQRDRLVRNSPFNMGQHHVVRVVNHDEGINARDCPYTRLIWVMFLAFPLDFQKDLYVHAAVAPYGRLLDWFTDHNKSWLLARVLVINQDQVPRSLVVSRGTTLGGNGRSWSVPVYILNGQFPDAFLGDEDPVPLDGEPHPEFGPIPLGPHPAAPNWQQELNGADLNLGFFGANPHPNPAHPIPLNQPEAAVMENDQAADLAFAGDNQAVDMEIDQVADMRLMRGSKQYKLRIKLTRSRQMLGFRMNQTKQFKVLSTLFFLRTT